VKRRFRSSLGLVPAGLAALALVLFWFPQLARGAGFAEVGRVFEGSFAERLAYSKSSAEPLFPHALVLLLVPTAHSVAIGRAISLTSGLLAISLGFRALGALRGLGAGAFACVYAFCPLLAAQATTFDSRAAWLLAATIYAFASRRAFEDEDPSPRSGRVAAIAAACMPALAPASIAALGFDALLLTLTHRTKLQRATLYVPAMIFAPVLWAIRPRGWLPSGTPAAGQELVYKVAAAGYGDIGVPVVVCLGLCLGLAIHRRDAVLGTSAGTALASMALVIGVARAGSVAAESALLPLPFVALAIARLFQGGGRWLWAGALALALFVVQGSLGAWRARSAGPEQWLDAARADFDTLRADSELSLHPAERLATLHYQLTGHTLSRAKRGRCRRDLCFEERGMTVHALDDPRRARGLVLLLEPSMAEQLDASCRRDTTRSYPLFRCDTSTLR